MNIVIMVGRLTKDPEIRYSQQGKAVCNFSVAVDRRIKREGDNNTDFFNCVCFGKTAEFVSKYFSSGKRIAIEGNIQNDSFVGRDGTKKTAVKIVCDNVEFADGKGKDWEPPKDDKLKEQDEGFLNIPDGAIDEELPFV